MVLDNQFDVPPGDVAVVPKAAEPEGAADLAEMAELRRSLREQQAEIEAIRQELLRQRESLDAERIRAADRIAREAEDIERQREELAAEQAALAAQREGCGVTPQTNLDADDEEIQEITAQDEAAAPSINSVEEDQPLEDEPAATPQSSPSQASSVEHEDPSIEEYMANLLKRMRGGAAAEAVSHEPRPSRKRPEPAPPAAPAPQAAEASPAAPAMIERTPEQAEAARRTQTLQTRDLAKMRELANTQARIAIDIHGRKRLVRSMVTRLGASLMFLLATFIVLNVLPENAALRTAALGGIVAAIYWLFGGAVDYQKLKNEPTSRKAAIRKQIEAASAENRG